MFWAKCKRRTMSVRCEWMCCGMKREFGGDPASVVVEVACSMLFWSSIPIPCAGLIASPKHQLRNLARQRSFTVKRICQWHTLRRMTKKHLYIYLFISLTKVNIPQVTTCSSATMQFFLFMARKPQRRNLWINSQRIVFWTISVYRSLPLEIWETEWARNLNLHKFM